MQFIVFFVDVLMKVIRIVFFEPPKAHKETQDFLNQDLQNILQIRKRKFFNFRLALFSTEG